MEEETKNSYIEVAYIRTFRAIKEDGCKVGKAKEISI